MTIRAEAPDIPNAWVLSTLHRRCGRPRSLGQIPPSGLPEHLPPHPIAGAGNHIAVDAGGRAAFDQCLAKVATEFHVAVTYQPASRYWAFQWYETLVFLGLAGLLAGLCFWWIRRRLS